jgi:hypothetical protein
VGIARLGTTGAAPYVRFPAWQRRLSPSLERLEKLRLLEKRKLIEAMAVTVAHDGTLNVAEAELLRTVCAILHCPMPPLLPAY